VGQQRLDIGGARIREHRHHRHQHQHRAEEGVKEELEARIDAVLAAPDADDQEHRDQARLEEQVEEHQIERHEHAQHQRFQHEEGDHVFLHAVVTSQRRRDGQRHDEGRQHHEQHADPVHPHLVFRPNSHSRSSTNWKPVSLGSKFHRMNSDTRKVAWSRSAPPTWRCAARPHPRRAGNSEDRRRDRGDEGGDGKQVVHVFAPAPPVKVIQVTSTRSRSPSRRRR
jgi:hypothetical protein